MTGRAYDSDESSEGTGDSGRRSDEEELSVNEKIALGGESSSTGKAMVSSCNDSVQRTRFNNKNLMKL